MAQEERDFEATGESVDEAIDKGLAQLGVKRNEVIVEVVDEAGYGRAELAGDEASMTVGDDGKSVALLADDG